MTEAIRCDGCGEFYDREFRMVGIEFNSDAVRLSKFTLDDLPTAVYDLVGSDGEGDLCVSCGRDALEELVALFGGDTDVE